MPKASEKFLPEFLDLKGLARYASLSVKTLRRILAGPGGPPSYCPGGKILIRLVDFENWLAGYKLEPEKQDRRVAQIVREFRGRVGRHG